MEKLGVQSLVMLAVAIGSIGTSVDKVFENGEVDLGDITEIPSMLGGLKDLAAVDFKQVLPQASDLDDQEKIEVAKAFNEHLNVHSDSLETAIETGFGILLEGIQALQILKSIGSKIKPSK